MVSGNSAEPTQQKHTSQTLRSRESSTDTTYAMRRTDSKGSSGFVRYSWGGGRRRRRRRFYFWEAEPDTKPLLRAQQTNLEELKQGQDVEPQIKGLAGEKLLGASHPAVEEPVQEAQILHICLFVWLVVASERVRTNVHARPLRLGVLPRRGAQKTARWGRPRPVPQLQRASGSPPE